MATLAADERRTRVAEATDVIRGLSARARRLQAEINEVLDEIVEADRAMCPGLPLGVLRNLRTARFYYGFCPCAWLRNENEQCNKGGLSD
jgi:hypothetical protein